MKDTRYSIRVGGTWSKEDFLDGGMAIEWSKTPEDVQRQVHFFKEAFTDYFPQPNGSAKYYWAIQERGMKKWRSSDYLHLIASAYDIERIVQITGLDAKHSKDWVKWTIDDFKSGQVVLKWLKSQKLEIDSFLSGVVKRRIVTSDEHSFYFINPQLNGSEPKLKTSGLQPEGTQLVDIRGFVQTNNPILPPETDTCSIQTEKFEERYQMVSRETLAILYDIACDRWKSVIEFKLNSADKFSNEIRIADSLVLDAWDQADDSKRVIMQKHLGIPKRDNIISANDLKNGEALVIVESSKSKGPVGKHIIRLEHGAWIIEDLIRIDPTMYSGVKVPAGSKYEITTK